MIKTDRQRAIRQILNYIYANSGKAPLMDNDIEKIQIFNELCQNGVITECVTTTTPVLANSYDKSTITKSKGYSVDKQMAEKLYGIKIPS